ncbi:MAG: hypothetical protein E7576_17030 [Ruminococcaceae bacterium]|jgi:hypothetical protein|nr:hypothetical protein [Oscillospiraceae bacterium]
MKQPSRISVLLAALLLAAGTASAGCSLSDITEFAGQFREEYAPPAQTGETGLVEGPPPPIVHPGDAETEAETETPPDGEDPEANIGKPDEGEETEAEPDPFSSGSSGTSGQASSRALTLKNAAAANETALLVARYGCVLTEEATVNGPRKGYHYLIDTPGGRASVEFCDMRGTPSGCFGTVRTADGVTLYASAADYDNPAVPVSLSEDARAFTAFDNPFAPYLDGTLSRIERPKPEPSQEAEPGEEGQEEAEAEPSETTDGILVRCESKDGTRRADFTLDARSYEIKSFTSYNEDGTVSRQVTYTLGADRFGAERITAALTDYYSLSPEELTFTLEDVRKANALSALLPVHGSAGYVFKTEENGKAKTEEAVAYESDGRQIVVYTDTLSGSPSERRYLRDGVRYPDKNGYAFKSADNTVSTENLISSFIPAGSVGSVTVSGSSVLFTVRSMQNGVPVMSRIIVEKDSLLLRSIETDTTGTNAHALSSLTVTRGGAKTDEAIFSSLGEERTVVYHVEWVNAPAEDLSFAIPAGWAFRLSFLSDAEYWYDADRTQPAPGSFQAAADGQSHEIWVTGAAKVTPADVSELSAAGLIGANAVSSLVARYGSVTMEGGDGTVSFRKDGSSWIRYVKNGSGESAEIGAVRMKAEDGWTSYVASYGDVVKNPDAAYAHDDAVTSLLENALKSGALKELVPVNGGNGTGDRMFYVPLGEERYIRITADRDTLALRSRQTVDEGAVEEETRFYYGVFAGEDFLAPWDSVRIAAFHVLNEGTEVAFIRVRIPQSAAFRLEMPDGWDWFFRDARLSDEVTGWIQVPAGDGDTELWTDNRDPATRPAVEPAEPEPTVQEPAEPEAPQSTDGPEAPQSADEPEPSPWEPDGNDSGWENGTDPDGWPDDSQSSAGNDGAPIFTWPLSGDDGGWN